MTDKIISTDNIQIINEYLNVIPQEKRDIYFTPEYNSLYLDSEEGKFVCFIFQSNNNLAIYPFFIKNINKYGYNLDKEYFDIEGVYGYTGIVSNSLDANFINDFYKAFNDYCKENNIVAEFTRFNPLIESYLFSKDEMKVIFDRETVVLDLSNDYEDIWINDYSSKNRNTIRKARKIGHSVDVIKNPSMSQINSFIDIYYYSMKAANAEDYYYFKREYFYKLFSLLSSRSILINVVDINNNIVCSSIFFNYGGYFHYHLSGRSENTDNSVNNFLLDEAIKYAKNIGAKKFHFGGGRTPDSEDSLLKFKASFSKERLKFYIGKKIHNADIYNQVVTMWENKNPELKEKYKNYLLKYRIK